MTDMALVYQESMRLRCCYQWFRCSPLARNAEEILSGDYDDLPVEEVVGCCGVLEDNESSECPDTLITCFSMDNASNASQELESSNISMGNESQESGSSNSVQQSSESPAPLESFAFLQERAPLRSGDGRRPFTAFISGDEYKALIKGCYYVPNPENPRIPLSDFAARIGGQYGAEYDHVKRCIMERARASRLRREQRRAERQKRRAERRKAGIDDSEEREKKRAAKKEKKQKKKEDKKEKKNKKRARRAAAAAAAAAAASTAGDADSKLMQSSEGNSGPGECSSSSTSSSAH